MLLRIHRVTKDYRRGIRANDDVSLEVDSGQVVGLLGHNGAGKTTLLNQVAGLTKPTSGTIHIDGKDAVADPAMARRVCSLQPQSQAPLDGVTPRQAIEIMSRLRGAGRHRARQRADELIAGLDLTEWADTGGEKLSGGVRRLTAFCMAAAEPGKVVMLDEPTNDVDPVRRRLLWDQIRGLARGGCAVLLVTHNVVEAERAVERVVVLHRGRVVGEGTPAELRARHVDRLRLELVAIDDATAVRLAGEFSGVDSPVIVGRRVVVSIEPAAASAALSRAHEQRARGDIDEFSVTPISLEDVYIGLIGTEEEVFDAARAA